MGGDSISRPPSCIIMGQYAFGVDGKMKKLLAKFAASAIVIALVLTSLSSAVLSSTASAAPALSIQGALADINLSPGQTYIHKMTITNSGDTPLDLIVEARGLGQTLDGSNIELTPEQDTSPYSARQYITGIDVPSFHLEAGGSQVVNATIQVPQSISPGTRYAIIYIHSQPTGALNVGYVVAADVPVILTVPGAPVQKTGTITDLSVPEMTSGQPLQVLTTFENTGNYYYKVKNQVTIIDEHGATISTDVTPLTTSSIIPTYSRLFTVTPTLPNPAKGLPAGNYTAESTIISDDNTVLDTKLIVFSIGGNYQSLPSGVNENSTVVKTFQNEQPSPVDAMAEAETMVELINTGNISGTIIIAAYSQEPVVPVAFSDPVGIGGTGKPAVKYVYVRSQGISQGTARITVRFTQTEVSNFDVNSLFLAYFDGKVWRKCENMTVYSGAGTIVGEVPVSALTGTIVGLGGDLLQSLTPTPPSTPATSSTAPPTSQPRGVSWTVAGGAIAGALIVGSGVALLLSRRRKITKS